MPKQNPVKVKLFVILGAGYLGPIDFTDWDDHTPESWVSPVMNGPLAIPLEMRTAEPRSLYSIRNRKKLDPRKTFRDQHVSSGDILVLSDQSDEQVPFALGTVLADQAGVKVEEGDGHEGAVHAFVRGAIKEVPVVGEGLAAVMERPKAKK
jgi:hypothetical protein